MVPARLIIDPPASGSWNMAVDQAILESVDEASSSSSEDDRRITLRFYRWHPATLSLGYFQKHTDRQLHPPSASCPLVRRATGGGAIVHDHELTYSLCIPDALGAVGHHRNLLLDTHSTLIKALESLDVVGAFLHSGEQNPSPPFLCFLRRADGDVVIGEHKIAGSAQRRSGQAMLQHGSILLARSASAPELQGINESASAQIQFDTLVAAWSPLLAQRLGVRWEHGELSAQEIRRAEIIDRQRFGDDRWSHKR